jgi:hypothetical protein
MASSLLTHVSSGPPRGTLILDGAGCGAARERFVSLAGGPEANFVYIITGASEIKLDDGSVYTPSASSTRREQTSRLEEELARYIGVKRIAVLAGVGLGRPGTSERPHRLPLKLVLECFADATDVYDPGETVFPSACPTQVRDRDGDPTSAPCDILQ